MPRQDRSFESAATRIVLAAALIAIHLTTPFCSSAGAKTRALPDGLGLGGLLLNRAHYVVHLGQGEVTVKASLELSRLSERDWGALCVFRGVGDVRLTEGAAMGAYLALDPQPDEARYLLVARGTGTLKAGLTIRLAPEETVRGRRLVLPLPPCARATLEVRCEKKLRRLYVKPGVKAGTVLTGAGATFPGTLETFLLQPSEDGVVIAWAGDPPKNRILGNVGPAPFWLEKSVTWATIRPDRVDTFAVVDIRRRANVEGPVAFDLSFPDGMACTIVDPPAGCQVEPYRGGERLRLSTSMPETIRIRAKGLRNFDPRGPMDHLQLSLGPIDVNVDGENLPPLEPGPTFFAYAMATPDTVQVAEKEEVTLVDAVVLQETWPGKKPAPLMAAYRCTGPKSRLLFSVTGAQPARDAGLWISKLEATSDLTRNVPYVDMSGEDPARDLITLRFTIPGQHRRDLFVEFPPETHVQTIIISRKGEAIREETCKVRQRVYRLAVGGTAPENFEISYEFPKQIGSTLGRVYHALPCFRLTEPPAPKIEGAAEEGGSNGASPETTGSAGATPAETDSTVGSAATVGDATGSAATEGEVTEGRTTEGKTKTVVDGQSAPVRRVTSSTAGEENTDDEGNGSLAEAPITTSSVERTEIVTTKGTPLAGSETERKAMARSVVITDLTWKIKAADDVELRRFDGFFDADFETRVFFLGRLSRATALTVLGLLRAYWAWLLVLALLGALCFALLLAGPMTNGVMTRTMTTAGLFAVGVFLVYWAIVSVSGGSSPASAPGGTGSSALESAATTPGSARTPTERAGPSAAKGKSRDKGILERLWGMADTFRRVLGTKGTGRLSSAAAGPPGGGGLLLNLGANRSEAPPLLTATDGVGHGEPRGGDGSALYEKRRSESTHHLSNDYGGSIRSVGRGESTIGPASGHGNDQSGWRYGGGSTGGEEAGGIPSEETSLRQATLVRKDVVLRRSVLRFATDGPSVYPWFGADYLTTSGRLLLQMFGFILGVGLFVFVFMLVRGLFVRHVGTILGVGVLLLLLLDRYLPSSLPPAFGGLLGLAGAMGAAKLYTAMGLYAEALRRQALATAGGPSVEGADAVESALWAGRTNNVFSYDDVFEDDEGIEFICDAPDGPGGGDAS